MVKSGIHKYAGIINFIEQEGTNTHHRREAVGVLKHTSVEDEGCYQHSSDFFRLKAEVLPGNTTDVIVQSRWLSISPVINSSSSHGAELHDGTNASFSRLFTTIFIWLTKLAALWKYSAANFQLRIDSFYYKVSSGARLARLARSWRAG